MRRLGIHLSMLVGLDLEFFTNGSMPSVFNGSDAFDIAQYNWNGHFGAAVTLADWDNDGWPDMTFGGTSGAIRTWRNLGWHGFEMMPLPWVIEE